MPELDEDATVDPAAEIAALAERAEAVAGLPLVDHADVFQRVHSDLQAALAEIDGA